MALETMKDVKEIGGFKVIIMDELKKLYPDKFNESGSMDYKWFEAEIRPKNFIYVRHDKNSISFTIQNGPIKENGVNGCQVDTLIYAAAEIIAGLDEKFPCDENQKAYSCLQNAIGFLQSRKKNREARGVEGENKS